jgi:RNA polymerase sigma-70 factor (ECF subfamily)
VRYTISDPVPGGGESTETRSVVYCVVPRDLAYKLHEPLREHFAQDGGIEVVVERRVDDRRVRATRRRPGAGPISGDVPDRRTVRSESGRRIAERRALAVSAGAAPALPRKARRYAERLVFLERLEPSGQQRGDADSKRLVTRYQAGEKGAFEELYLRYFEPIYTYARVALAEHHAAEDVTQQVFVRALPALERYELRAGVPFRGWLFAIARNTVIDALREQHSLKPEPSDRLELLREQDGALRDPDLSDRLSWLSDREISMFVERLPLAQRQVLVLRFMLDLSGQEIAQVMGRSHLSVRQLQVRAVATLRRRLAAVGREAPHRRRDPVRARVRGGASVIVPRRFALGIAPGRGGRAPGRVA